MSMRELQLEAFDEVDQFLTNREMGMVILNGSLGLFVFPNSKKLINILKTESSSGSSGIRSNSIGDKKTEKKHGSFGRSGSGGAVTPTSLQWQNTVPSKKLVSAAAAHGHSKSHGAANAANSVKSEETVSVFAGVQNKKSNTGASTDLVLSDPAALGGIKTKSQPAKQSKTRSRSGSRSNSRSNSIVASDKVEDGAILLLALSASNKTSVSTPIMQLKREDQAGADITTNVSYFSPNLVKAIVEPFPVRNRSASIGGNSSSAVGALTSHGREAHPRSASLDLLSDKTSARRIHAELSAILNYTFPDYDFSQTKLEAFISVPVSNVVRTVSNYLSEIAALEPAWLDNLWAAINSEVKMSACQVFSYVPDMEGDPFSEGSVWSFNYFFVDSDLKQIVYFSCMATAGSRRGRQHAAGYGDTDDALEYHSSDDDEDSETYRLRDGSSPVSVSPGASPTWGYSPSSAYSPRTDRSEQEQDDEDDMDTQGGYAQHNQVAAQAADDSDSSRDEMN